jgi:hypothetical protein
MLPRRAEKPDEITHRVVAVLGVAKRKLVVDLVAIPASVARPRQVSDFLELADDLSDRSLGDTDRRGHVSQPCRRILGNDSEHVSVVRNEAEGVVVVIGT